MTDDVPVEPGGWGNGKRYPDLLAASRPAELTAPRLGKPQETVPSLWGTCTLCNNQMPKIKKVNQLNPAWNVFPRVDYLKESRVKQIVF